MNDLTSIPNHVLQIKASAINGVDGMPVQNQGVFTTENDPIYRDGSDDFTDIPSIEFDRTESQRIRVVDAGLHTPNATSFVVFRLSSIDNNDITQNGYIFNLESSAVATWAVQVRNESGRHTWRAVWKDDSSTNTLFDTDVLLDNSFNVLALTKDASGGRFYINGVLIASDSNSADIEDAAAGFLSIGCNASTADSFKGRFYEYDQFSVGMSEADIVKITDVLLREYPNPIVGTGEVILENVLSPEVFDDYLNQRYVMLSRGSVNTEIEMRTSEYNAKHDWSDPTSIISTPGEQIGSAGACILNGTYHVYTDIRIDSTNAIKHWSGTDLASLGGGDIVLYRSTHPSFPGGSDEFVRHPKPYVIGPNSIKLFYNQRTGAASSGTGDTRSVISVNGLGTAFNQADSIVELAPTADGGFASTDTGSPSYYGPTGELFFNGFNEDRADPDNLNAHQVGRAFPVGGKFVLDPIPLQPHSNNASADDRITGGHPCVWDDREGNQIIYDTAIDDAGDRNLRLLGEFKPYRPAERILTTVGVNLDKADYSITGDLKTLDALDSAQDTQHSNTQAAVTALNNLSSSNVEDAVDNKLSEYSLDSASQEIEGIKNTIGVSGAGLTALPWNASWDTEVQSEVSDALTAFNVVATSNLPANFTDLAITASTGLISVGTNNDKTGYQIAGTINTLDDLDTAQDSQHANVITSLTGVIDNLSSSEAILHAATLTAVGNLNDISTSDVRTQADAALTAYAGPTNIQMVAAFTEIKGGGFDSATDTLEQLRDNAGGTGDLSGLSDQISALSSQVIAVIGSDVSSDDCQSTLSVLEGSIEPASKLTNRMDQGASWWIDCLWTYNDEAVDLDGYDITANFYYQDGTVAIGPLEVDSGITKLVSTGTFRVNVTDEVTSALDSISKSYVPSIPLAFQNYTVRLIPK